MWTPASLPIWTGTSPLLVTIFSFRLCCLLFISVIMQEQKIRNKILHALTGHVCLKVCVCISFLQWQVLAVTAPGDSAVKIWHQVTLYMCRSLWLGNPQPGEHPLCDYSFRCRCIKGVWYTLLYLDFTMSDGRKKKISEVCPISVDLANIKLEYKETCIWAKHNTGLIVAKSECQQNNNIKCSPSNRIPFYWLLPLSPMIILWWFSLESEVSELCDGYEGCLPTSCFYRH